MTKVDYTILALGVFIAALAWVSWRSRSDERGRTFVIGTIGWRGVFSSFIAFFHAGPSLMFWFGLVAVMGFGALWLSVAFAAFLAVMALVAPQAQRLARRYRYITLPDLIGDRQGPLTARALAGLSLYGSVVVATAQLNVAGNVIAGLFDTGPVIGTISAAAVVAAYIALGGFLSVVRTDVYQSAVILLIALGALMFSPWPEAGVIAREVVSPDLHMLVGVAMVGVTIPAWSDLWQRIFAAKSPSVARSAMLWVIPTKLLISVGMVVFVTNILAASAGAELQNIYRDIYSGDVANPLVIALLGVFIISAMLSTLDNQVFNVTSIATQNILKLNEQSDRKRYILTLRAISLAMLAALTALSLTIDDLVHWLIRTTAFIGIMTPYALYAVLKHRESASDVFLTVGLMLSAAVYWLLFFLGYYDVNLIWLVLPYSLSLLFVLVDYIALFVMQIAKPSRFDRQGIRTGSIKRESSTCGTPRLPKKSPSPSSTVT